jgi:hypothetical protein
LSQLRQQQDKLDQLDVRVKVITFDSPEMAEKYVNETHLSWPLLLDPQQELYRDYGLLRGSWWDLYQPASIWKYVKLIAGGEHAGKPGRDWNQLGGDVLIDPQSIIRLHHVSQGPHHRPDVACLTAVVENNSIPSATRH